MQYALHGHMRIRYVELTGTEIFSWSNPVQHRNHIYNQQLVLRPNSYSSLEVKPVTAQEKKRSQRG